MKRLLGRSNLFCVMSFSPKVCVAETIFRCLFCPIKRRSLSSRPQLTIEVIRIFVKRRIVMAAYFELARLYLGYLMLYQTSSFLMWQRFVKLLSNETEYCCYYLECFVSIDKQPLQGDPRTWDWFNMWWCHVAWKYKVFDYRSKQKILEGPVPSTKWIALHCQK